MLGCSTRTWCRTRSPSGSSCGPSTGSSPRCRSTGTRSNSKVQDYIVAGRELNLAGLQDSQQGLDQRAPGVHARQRVRGRSGEPTVRRLPDLHRFRPAEPGRHPGDRAADLLQPDDQRLLDRRQRRHSGVRQRQRQRADELLLVRRQGWGRGREPVGAACLRHEVRRGELPVLLRDHRQLEDHVHPRPAGAGAEGGAVPDRWTPIPIRRWSTAGSSTSSTPTRRPTNFPYAQDVTLSDATINSLQASTGGPQQADTDRSPTSATR